MGKCNEIQPCSQTQASVSTDYTAVSQKSDKNHIKTIFFKNNKLLHWLSKLPLQNGPLAHALIRRSYPSKHYYSNLLARLVHVAELGPLTLCTCHLFIKISLPHKDLELTRKHVIQTSFLFQKPS